MEWRAYQANADTDVTKIREWVPSSIVAVCP